MRIPRRALAVVGIILLIGLIIISIVTLIDKKQQNDEAARQAALQAEFEQLVNNPEELYNKVKQSAEGSNAITKIDYKLSNSATDLLEQVATILEGRGVSEHLKDVRENKTEAGQKRSDQVLDLMSKSQEGILVDLGITPNTPHTYNLTSTDIVYDGSPGSIDQIIGGLTDEMQGVCVFGEFNCLNDIQGKPPTTNIVTLYPVKVSDDPLTYRVYALLRATTK